MSCTSFIGCERSRKNIKKNKRRVRRNANNVLRMRVVGREGEVHGFRREYTTKLKQQVFFPPLGLVHFSSIIIAFLFFWLLLLLLLALSEEEEQNTHLTHRHTHTLRVHRLMWKKPKEKQVSLSLGVCSIVFFCFVVVVLWKMELAVVDYT